MTQIIHTAEKRFYYVETRAGVYRTQYESAFEEPCDNLMEDSAAAILCFDFADLVVQGNNLYESINSLDNDSRTLVYREEIPFVESCEKCIRRLYALWLDVSRKVVIVYSKIESDFLRRGFDATPIHELRKAIREAEAMSKCDSDFFTHSKLVDLRDQAIDDLRAGNDLEFVLEAD